MQIVYAAYLTRSSVEQLRGKSFRQRVVTFLLVTRYQIVAFFYNHAIESWYFVGRVLQISIHRNHHIALCLFKATIQGWALSIVAAKLDAFHVFRLAT